MQVMFVVVVSTHSTQTYSSGSVMSPTQLAAQVKIKLWFIGRSSRSFFFFIYILGRQGLNPKCRKSTHLFLNTYYCIYCKNVSVTMCAFIGGSDTKQRLCRRGELLFPPFLINHQSCLLKGGKLNTRGKTEEKLSGNFQVSPAIQPHSNSIYR